MTPRPFLLWERFHIRSQVGYWFKQREVLQPKPRHLLFRMPELPWLYVLTGWFKARPNGAGWILQCYPWDVCDEEPIDEIKRGFLFPLPILPPPGSRTGKISTGRMEDG
jgi:hypothetical protein